MTVESPDTYGTTHRSLEGSRILIVDDEATVRTILRQILENAGYTVTEVASCGEILHHLDKDTYDLMLLDILMPGMDSLDMLKSVRQKYTMSELPVIMVTVKEESADVVEAFSLGANDYIVKPVDFAVLRARIKTHLFHKRAEDELRKANEELEHRVAERTAELLAINKALVSEIAERKQQDEELRESETRFQQMAEGIDDVFVISDVKSKSVLYASPAYEQIWGRPVQDLYEDYRHWDEGIHPDDRPRVQEAWARMKDQGDRYEEEYRVLRPDGSMRWVHSRGYSVHDESGQPYRVAEIVQDITEFKQTQQALQEREAMLADAAKLSTLGYATWSEEQHCYLSVSEEYARIYGYSADEYMRRFNTHEKSLETIHPEDRAQFEVAYFNQTKTDDVRHYEFRAIRKDKQVRHIKEWARPVKDSAGKPLHTLVIAQDVTDFKQAGEKLRESEARFQQLAKVTDDVFVISDMESWDVLYASPAYERIWGRPVQDLIKDYRNWDEGIHPDDRLGMQEAWVQMLRQGDRYEEEYRVLHPDGSMRWVRSRSYPIRDESGRIYRVAAFVTDITARKQQQQELRESEARFQQLAGVIDDVFAISDVKSWEVLYASPAYE
ncbi:MAG: PAS domain-containing protein, partial [Proteobacteria bacterium]|nr:PAS domain-containing protein [Pseudomonadota bacterium]